MFTLKSKTLILGIFAACITLSAGAQQLVSGSVKQLRGQQEMAFAIDYSQVRIDGMTESMFRVQRMLEEEHADGWEDRWEGKTLPRLHSCFREGVNTRSRIKLGTSRSQTQYVATYVLEELYSNGSNKGRIIIRDTASKEDVAIIRIQGTCSDKRGSWEKRMFGGMKNAGSKLGTFLRNRL